MEASINTAIRGILWIHVLAGTLALVVAPVALVTAKGGLTHRRWGKVYFWAMAVVAATLAASTALLALGIIRPTPRFRQLSTVAIVFGFVGLSSSGLDLWRF